MGEGAHTHYWDRHGHDTAWMLDQLIVDAMSEASATSTRSG
jgi:hypothetical protein